jgi:hypothetical protein
MAGQGMLYSEGAELKQIFGVVSAVLIRLYKYAELLVKKSVGKKLKPPPKNT